MTIPDAADLDAMIREVAAGPPIYRPSAFWEQLAGLNLEQLRRRGYEAFKRTVNQNYFNWLPTTWGDNQFRSVRRHWQRHKTLRPFLLRFDAPHDLEAFSRKGVMAGWRERWCYKLFVGMLWEYARQEDPERLLDRLEEPRLGRPLEIRRGGRLISQDLANSVRERYAILRHAADLGPEPFTVAELGGGYGRLAYVFLKTTACRYYLVDIPPALHLAQWYLSRLLPERRIFRFRPFAAYREIEDELARADLAFFTPNQMEMLPDEHVDVFVNISSLHEMRREQIRWYMDLMEHKAARLLFLKQWSSWHNPIDQVTVEHDDYLPSARWRILDDRADSVQELFFELLAGKVRPSETPAPA